MSKNHQFLRQIYLDNPYYGLGIPIWQSFSLDTINVAYAIQRTDCHTIHVGETGNSLQTRMYQHMYHLSKGEKSTVLYK